jgi:PTS system, glucose subfamily, IIA component
MFGFGKMRHTEIKAAANGRYLPLTDLNDGVFSKGTIGDGVVIQMSDDLICSPCDGILTMVFPTRHAFGVKRNDGFEVLVHIGIDTVNLKGKGFQQLVKQNSVVKSGQPIIQIDQKIFSENNYVPYVIMIITNSNGIKYQKHEFVSAVRGETCVIKTGD